jgi:hypothetical protein
MHGESRDPLFARADDAIKNAHRILAEADLLRGVTVSLCRNAEQAKILQTGLPPAWSIALLVTRNASAVPP